MDQVLTSSDTPALIADLRRTISSVFRGDGRAVDLLLTGFLAGGHVLIEDIPGVGKTTLARALAQSLGGDFNRIQCTPDLMPADISGVGIYDERERDFRFHPGPVFTDILLADELNRTPPRTQSALLEAMSEGQVTVDGTTRPLAETFFCIATQNPLDHVGTYPLPDSQRDRFLIRFDLGYPDRAGEMDLLAHDGAEEAVAATTSVCDLKQASDIRKAVRRILIKDPVRAYLVEFVSATRSNPSLSMGASPRAALGLQRATQARALLDGRTFVTPEDVQKLIVPCLAHRVIAKPGHDPQEVLLGLVESISVPR